MLATKSRALWRLLVGIVDRRLRLEHLPQRHAHAGYQLSQEEGARESIQSGHYGSPRNTSRRSAPSAFRSNGDAAAANCTGAVVRTRLHVTFALPQRPP